jgi:hypothetical protein
MGDYAMTPTELKRLVLALATTNARIAASELSIILWLAKRGLVR